MSLLNQINSTFFIVVVKEKKRKEQKQKQKQELKEPCKSHRVKFKSREKQQSTPSNAEYSNNIKLLHSFLFLCFFFFFARNISP
jgi:hypothetical protein